jgi:flagellar biosynthesis protein FlhG
MISLETMQSSEIQKIRVASAYLFSLDHAKDDVFLESLAMPTIKKAFRSKAKRYHPDHCGHSPPDDIRKREERFVKVEEAYRVLSSYLSESDSLCWTAPRRERLIIAVGGAKGGIGKSVITANLAVFLAGLRKKVVAVDLDLGGANLHLYLGETFLKWSINDYLEKRVSTLDEIAVPTRYGPLLLGGDSSRLGASNIGFSQKLRLMKAIKEMDADYIILDLGGDTSFNVIDLFLTAHRRIVVTTCDPASYLEAYNLIKVALSRRLSRLFGVESELRWRKDEVLERIIGEFTRSQTGSKVRPINELLWEVEKKVPGQVGILRDAIARFSPSLLVNRVSDRCNVRQVVRRLQDVSRSILSVNLDYLGSLPQQTEIEVSARSLVPLMTSHPDSLFAREAKALAVRLIDD